MLVLLNEEDVSSDGFAGGTDGDEASRLGRLESCVMPAPLTLLPRSVAFQTVLPVPVIVAPLLYQSGPVAVGVVVDHLVVGEGHGGAGVQVTLFAIGVDDVVLIVGALLDDVAGDRRIAAVRQVDRIGRACRCCRECGCW